MKTKAHSSPAILPLALDSNFPTSPTPDGRVLNIASLAETPASIAVANSPLDIWSDIFDAADAMAKREPLLATHLQRIVLTQASLAGAVAAVLAHRLHGSDLPETVLKELCEAEFDNEESIVRSIAADLFAVRQRDPACASYLHVLLNLKGFQALQTHRLSHLFWNRGRSELAFFLANKASLIFAIDIHPAARIGRGVMLDHGAGIVIGETAVVEDNVSLLQEVTLGGTGKENGDRHPKVRSGVMIGAGAKILGNIEIGMMSKVAAGSVVLRDVPAYCTVAGVPARIVRQVASTSFPSLEMDQSV